jgi:nicotinate-nucleotide adenylyltransferase
MREYVALYGGSFDPPHNGHVLTISHLLNDERIAEVWLSPSGDARYDKAPVASGAERVAMLNVVHEELFNKSSRIRIVELQQDGDLGESTAISLVKALREEGEKRPFFYVIGADNLATLPQWREFDVLIQEVTFLLVPRLGEAIPDVLPPYVVHLSKGSVAACSFSSTELRELLMGECEVAGYLPLEVLRVIEERGLYGRSVAAKTSS